jgi:hypothetical protein
MSLHAAVRSCVPMLEADRRQDADIAAVLELLREDRLPLGAPAPRAAGARTARPALRPTKAIKPE